jgi:peptidoglycan/LPS O-acetylase OafA/YrhL
MFPRMRGLLARLSSRPESVPGLVFAIVGGGVVVAAVSVAFGHSREYGARDGAFIAIIIGATEGWRLYRQNAQHLRVWFAVLLVLGALALFVLAEAAFGEDPIVALMVAVVGGSVFAAYVASDYRGTARARGRDAGHATP